MQTLNTVIIFQGHKGIPKEKYLNSYGYTTDFLAFYVPLLNTFVSKSSLLAKKKKKNNLQFFPCIP